MVAILPCDEELGTYYYILTLATHDRNTGLPWLLPGCIFDPTQIHVRSYSPAHRYHFAFDLRSLTIISIVRIPVELVLYWLSVHKAVPELMTFAGRNFDIFAGLTAPIVYYACFKVSKVSNKTLLLVWNIISLGLLLNIVINAVLSAPFRFQKFAFDQPNIAILYFPFIWLPCFIVMVILLSHLASIRKLSKPEIRSTPYID
jgi:hypothetical protein